MSCIIDIPTTADEKRVRMTKLPPAIWLEANELEQLSGPHGQRAVMGMKYYTGSAAKPVPHVLVLYSDGLTEFTHKYSDANPPNWVILLHQEAKKAGHPVTGEVKRALRHQRRPDCPRCLQPLRLCLCPRDEQTLPDTQGV